MNTRRILLAIVLGILAFPVHAVDLTTRTPNDFELPSILKPEIDLLNSLGILGFCGKLKHADSESLKLFIAKRFYSDIPRAKQVYRAAIMYIAGVSSGLKDAIAVSGTKKSFCSVAIPVATDYIAQQQPDAS